MLLGGIFAPHMPPILGGNLRSPTGTGIFANTLVMLSEIGDVVYSWIAYELQVGTSLERRHN